MIRPPESRIVIPGFGEDPEMMRPFAHELSEELGEEVAVADIHRRRDGQRERVPSLEQAYRVGRQLGFDDIPAGIVPISHSRGARIASHFADKPDEVMLAPEGMMPGGKKMTRAFTRDILSRLVAAGDDERSFAWRQTANIVRHPVESWQQEREMKRTAAPNVRRDMAERALVIHFLDDPVITRDHIAAALLRHPRSRLKKLPGGHYEPFEHPRAVAKVVADYLHER